MSNTLEAVEQPVGGGFNAGETVEVDAEEAVKLSDAIAQNGGQDKPVQVKFQMSSICFLKLITAMAKINPSLFFYHIFLFFISFWLSSNSLKFELNDANYKITQKQSVTC